MQLLSLDEVVRYYKQDKPSSDDGVILNSRLRGLWIRLSFFNHACNENTYKFTVGNIVFVRAKRDISQGEELTTSYIPLDTTFPEKQKKLGLYFLICQCEWCMRCFGLSKQAKEKVNDVWKMLIVRNKKETSYKKPYFEERYPMLLELVKDSPFHFPELSLSQ
mmetsp:Transcript_9369/g.7152  ORF Transcript_9369/g.7152 Transcript_9369/m.7152 type:complete len:163 (+) Transcript_9369:1610-2098(+)